MGDFHSVALVVRSRERITRFVIIPQLPNIRTYIRTRTEGEFYGIRTNHTKYNLRIFRFYSKQPPSFTDGRDLREKASSKRNETYDIVYKILKQTEATTHNGM